MPRKTWAVHIYLFMALLFNNAIIGLIDKEFRTSSSESCPEKSQKGHFWILIDIMIMKRGRFCTRKLVKF